MNNEIKVEHETNKKKAKIDGLRKEMEYNDIQNQTRYDALFESKKEMERMNEDKIQQMLNAHQIELERRKQDYQDKMEADQLRF